MTEDEPGQGRSIFLSSLTLTPTVVDARNKNVGHIYTAAMDSLTRMALKPYSHAMSFWTHVAAYSVFMTIFTFVFAGASDLPGTLMMIALLVLIPFGIMLDLSFDYRRMKKIISELKENGCSMSDAIIPPDANITVVPINMKNKTTDIQRAIAQRIYSHYSSVVESKRPIRFFAAWYAQIPITGAALSAMPLWFDIAAIVISWIGIWIAYNTRKVAKRGIKGFSEAIDDAHSAGLIVTRAPSRLSDHLRPL